MDAQERTKLLRELMDTHKLTALDVANVFTLTKAAVRAWRYGKFPIPQHKLTILLEKFK